MKSWRSQAEDLHVLRWEVAWRKVAVESVVKGFLAAFCREMNVSIDIGIGTDVGICT